MRQKMFFASLFISLGGCGGHFESPISVSTMFETGNGATAKIRLQDGMVWGTCSIVPPVDLDPSNAFDCGPGFAIYHSMYIFASVDSSRTFTVVYQSYDGTVQVKSEAFTIHSGPSLLSAEAAVENGSGIDFKGTAPEKRTSLQAICFDPSRTRTADVSRVQDSNVLSIEHHFGNLPPGTYTCRLQSSQLIQPKDGNEFLVMDQSPPVQVVISAP